MGEAILRREEYLRKVANMPNFSLGLTPPLGEEATWDNVVKLSTQYQEVGATFPQAASPSSEHQEEEQMEVCEKDVALEERGGGVEIVGEKDVVVEERSDGAEMVGEKDVLVDEGGGDEVRLERFKRNLHHELQRVAHIKLTALDLNQRIDIIDNSSKVVSNNQKYGKVSADLKNMVMNYLKSEGLEAKSDRFKSAKLTRIKTAWRDNENKEDCSVYVMRPMETFMGTLAKDCDCGLERGNQSQLERLRVKYTAAILSAQINELWNENKDKAMRFFKKE
nr:uncharacterized protein LOC109175178 [Ipomoea batatas]